MKQTIDFYQFTNQFERIRPDQFSREALSLLWDYFEEYEDDTQTEMELDVIAICCQFTEQHFSVIANDYSIDGLEEFETDEEKAEAVVEWLQENTSAIGILDDKVTIVYDYEF
jgi:hypothetical protein